MENMSEQNIKGNNNTQTILNVTAGGLSLNDVIAYVKSNDFVSKQQVIEIVKDAIKDIPDFKKVLPNNRIFMPLVQQLSYSTEEEIIKTKYKNMLRSTMNLDKIEKVHPAFSNILAQLSSDEIKILDSLPLRPLNNIPLLNMRIKINKEKGVGVLQVKYFSDIGFGICQFPNNICKYIENLERLKLIEIPYGMYLTDESKYVHLINNQYLDNVRKKISYNKDTSIEFDYDRMIFRLTSFGIDFINCCKD